MQAIKAIFFVTLFFFASFANCKTAYAPADLYLAYFEFVVSHKFNRFDANLIIKAVSGCTKDGSLMCSATRKILESKVKDGSESATLLLAAQLLEVDPVKNRVTSDKMLYELLTGTQDKTLRNRIAQMLAPKLAAKQKVTKESINQVNKGLPTVSNDTHATPPKAETKEDSETVDIETPSPKRLTIIFGN